MSDFWSRRRAAVEAETASAAQAEAAAARAAEDAALEERSDAELLAELNLCDPDEMDSTDEVQALLRAVVPQRLKARALRRLWRLNPVLANVDGLVDYGEDFTDAATVVENMQTAYQVGRGMLKTLTEPAPEDAESETLAELEDAPDPDTPAEDDDAQDVPELDMQVETARAEHDTPQAAYPSADDTPEPPAFQRRMRFRFDTAS